MVVEVELLNGDMSDESFLLGPPINPAIPPATLVRFLPTIPLAMDLPTFFKLSSGMSK